MWQKAWLHILKFCQNYTQLVHKFRKFKNNWKKKNSTQTVFIVCLSNNNKKEQSKGRLFGIKHQTNAFASGQKRKCQEAEIWSFRIDLVEINKTLVLPIDLKLTMNNSILANVKTLKITSSPYNKKETNFELLKGILIKK